MWHTTPLNEQVSLWAFDSASVGGKLNVAFTGSPERVRGLGGRTGIEDRLRATGPCWAAINARWQKPQMCYDGGRGATTVFSCSRTTQRGATMSEKVDHGELQLLATDRTGNVYIEDSLSRLNLYECCTGHTAIELVLELFPAAYAPKEGEWSVAIYRNVGESERKPADPVGWLLGFIGPESYDLRFGELEDAELDRIRFGGDLLLDLGNSADVAKATKKPEAG